MKNLEELTAKYVLQELNSEKKEDLQNWLELSDVNKTKFRELVKSFRYTQAHSMDINTKRDWKLLETKLKFTKSRTIKMWSYVASAAAIAIIAAFSFFLSPADFNLFKPEMAEVVTDSLHQKKIKLHDGTLVWLNRNTRLRFPKKFDGDKRTIELQGEAYFEVARDTLRPFSITTQHTITKVLGTSFNIRSYPNAESDHIQVYTGKVSYSDGAKQELILTKEMEASYQRRKNHLQLNKTYNPNSLAWKTRKLVFDSVSLEQVMADLARVYGVQVFFEKADWQKTEITTRFEQMNLIECMDILSESLGFNYTFKNNIIRIK